MPKAKKVVKKAVKPAKKENKNEFKVVRKDDSRISARVDSCFRDECHNTILLDKASRDKLGIDVESNVFVKKGVLKETAVVYEQFKELVGTNSATLNNVLAEILGVKTGDKVIIEPAPEECDCGCDEE